MKSKIIFTRLLVPILLLSACGNAGTSTTSTAQGGTNTQELPPSTKLAIGTLKLEGTNFAVTSAQASNLLPLWQVYSSLVSSDTAAQEEKDALTEQIQEAMTNEQLKAIDDMKLTQRDVLASMQELGLTPQLSANGTPQPGGNFSGGGQGGGFPGGGFPGGGGGNGGGPEGFGRNGGQLSPDQIATAQARRAENGGGGGFNNRLITPLVEAVITLLESK